MNKNIELSKINIKSKIHLIRELKGKSPIADFVYHELSPLASVSLINSELTSDVRHKNVSCLENFSPEVNFVNILRQETLFIVFSNKRTFKQDLQLKTIDKALSDYEPRYKEEDIEYMTIVIKYICKEKTSGSAEKKHVSVFVYRKALYID